MKWSMLPVKNGQECSNPYSPKTVLLMANSFLENVTEIKKFKKAKRTSGDVLVAHIVWDKPGKKIKHVKKASKNYKLVWANFSCVDNFTFDNINLNAIESFKYHIWEPPMCFNPFIEETVRLPMKIYNKELEKGIGGDRKYDFTFFIDRMRYNGKKIMRIAKELEKDYKVKMCVINGPDANKYKMKDTFVGNKPGGRKRFQKILHNSKVFVDLSYRWTVGRTVIEALYCGALSVCTHTYAGSHQVMKPYIVDTFSLDMKKTYDMCIKAHKDWNKNLIKKLRDNAYKTASYQTFYKELKEKTREILNGS